MILMILMILVLPESLSLLILPHSFQLLLLLP
jgi:hypothetical protein